MEGAAVCGLVLHLWHEMLAASREGDKDKFHRDFHLSEAWEVAEKYLTNKEEQE